MQLPFCFWPEETNTSKQKQYSKQCSVITFNCESENMFITFCKKKRSSFLCPLFHRPSSLISVRLFTHGHHSPTEYLLTANQSSCWSMSCMLWCLRLYAIAAAPTLPSSSGQCQRRKGNDSVSGKERVPWMS